MPKIRILNTCPACNGRAYIPIGEAINTNGDFYMQCKACPTCEGSGNKPHWVTLDEFARLLQPYLCRHKNTSFVGGMHFSAGEVWDDILEVCSDCGTRLE